MAVPHREIDGGVSRAEMLQDEILLQFEQIGHIFFFRFEALFFFP